MDIEKKNPILDNFKVINSLGQGLNSRVKLALNNDDGLHYALKIMKNSGNSILNYSAIRNEFQILQQLNHPNIIKQFSLVENGFYKVPNSTQTKNVLYSVMEYASNGELFEYLYQTGRFSEKVSRFYFHQLIEALEYCHNQGIAHRDLKPENLLFDEFFNLKMADFGFSTAIAGRDGSGKLLTHLGTKNYIAPEIYLKMPYSGVSVDLFACSIVLFNMYAGIPPFSSADPKNSRYKLICTNKHQQFWNDHISTSIKKYQENIFNIDFMNLMNACLAFDPTQRLSMAELKSHPWYQGPVPSKEEIQYEFNQRAQIVRQKLEKLKQIKQIQQQDKKYLLNIPNINLYTGIQIQRDLEASQREDKILEFNEEFHSMLKSLKIKDINQENLKLFDFQCSIDPDILFPFLIQYCQKNFNQIILSKEYFKIFCKLIEEDSILEISIQIKKIKENLILLDFKRKKGLINIYYESIIKIQEEIISKFAKTN